jgi:uncharacterized protein
MKRVCVLNDDAYVFLPFLGRFLSQDYPILSEDQVLYSTGAKTEISESTGELIHRLIDRYAPQKIYVLRWSDVLKPAGLPKVSDSQLLVHVIVTEISGVRTFHRTQPVAGSIEYANVFVSEAVNWKRKMLAGDWLQRMMVEAGTLVYNDGSLKGDMPAGVSQIARPRDVFEAKIMKASGFFAGSRFFLELGDRSLAAFLLHQAYEHLLRSLIHALLGANPMTHDLLRLKNILQFFFAPAKSFALPATDHMQLLTSAYIHARYTDNFSIDITLLGMLSEHWELLHKEIILFFEAIVDIEFSIH